jgi:hypothetical protein
MRLEFEFLSQTDACSGYAEQPASADPSLGSA